MERLGSRNVGLQDRQEVPGLFNGNTSELPEFDLARRERAAFKIAQDRALSASKGSVFSRRRGRPPGSKNKKATSEAV